MHATDRTVFFGGPTLNRPSQAPNLRLFILHHAGGSSLYYAGWKGLFGPEIDLVPVDLPGHGRRHQESCLTDADAAVESIFTGLQPLLSMPYAIMGHSMGAYLGVRLIHALNRSDAPKPLFFVASSAQSPYKPLPIKSTLSKRLLLEHIQSLGGLPEEILANEEFLDYIYPVLRNDFQLCETSRLGGMDRLSQSIYYVRGHEDRYDESDVEGWRGATSGSFQNMLFPGGHFYFKDNLPALMRVIKEAFQTHAPAVFAGRGRIPSWSSAHLD